VFNGLVCTTYSFFRVPIFKLFSFTHQTCLYLNPDASKRTSRFFPTLLNRVRRTNEPASPIANESVQPERNSQTDRPTRTRNVIITTITHSPSPLRPSTPIQPQTPIIPPLNVRRNGPLLANLKSPNLMLSPMSPFSAS